MEKLKEKLPTGESAGEMPEKFNDDAGAPDDWEKELEEKKKEHLQEKKLNKLIKKLVEEKENRPYRKKKFQI